MDDVRQALGCFFLRRALDSFKPHSAEWLALIRFIEHELGQDPDSMLKHV